MSISIASFLVLLILLFAQSSIASFLVLLILLFAQS